MRCERSKMLKRGNNCKKRKAGKRKAREKNRGTKTKTNTRNLGQSPT